MNPATQAVLDGIAQFRKKLQQGRILSPEQPGGVGVQWDLHEQRLDVIEDLVRADRPDDEALRAELTRELIQDFQAEVAATMSKGGSRPAPSEPEAREDGCSARGGVIRVDLFEARVDVAHALRIFDRFGFFHQRGTLGIGSQNNIDEGGVVLG